MRRLVMIAVAVAIAGAGVAAADRARAAGAWPRMVNGQVATIDPFGHVACRRRSWHGWGWYPCRTYYAPRYGAYGSFRRPYRYGYRGWHRHWW